MTQKHYCTLHASQLQNSSSLLSEPIHHGLLKIQAVLLVWLWLEFQIHLIHLVPETQLQEGLRNSCHIYKTKGGGRGNRWNKCNMWMTNETTWRTSQIREHLKRCFLHQYEVWIYILVCMSDRHSLSVKLSMTESELTQVHYQNSKMHIFTLLKPITCLVNSPLENGQW